MMMERAFFSLGCLILLMSLLLTTQSLYASENLEAFFPPSSAAVVVVPNLKFTGEKLHQYIQTLPLPHSLQSFLQNVSFWQSIFERFSGITLANLGPIFQASCAIALFDPGTIEHIQQHSLKFPALLLAADVTNSAEALQQLLEKVVHNHIQMQVPSVEFRIKSVQGLKLWIISNAHFQCAYTFWDQIFLLTTTPEYLERLMIERQCSSRNHNSCASFRSLWNADEYHAARDVISHSDHDIRVYMNIVQIQNIFQRMYQTHCAVSFASEFQRLFQIVESFSVHSLIWLCSLSEQGGHERLLWEFDQLAQGDFRPDTRKEKLQAVENDLLVSDQVVPANVLYYQARRINLPLWWQRCKHVVDTFLPDTQQEQFSRQIQALEHTLSFRLEEDLFPVFGSEVAIACYDPARRLHQRTPETSLEHFPCLFLIIVHNKEQLEQRLQAIPTVSRSKILVQGIPVSTLELPGALPPVILYAAVIKDFLVVSLSQQALQRVITVAQQGGALASSPDYVNVSTSFATRCIARSYFHLKYFFQRFSFPHQSSDEKNATLPASMTGIISVTTLTSSGMLTESFSTLGGTFLGTVVTALYILSAR